VVRQFKLIKYFLLFFFISTSSFALEKWTIDPKKSSIQFKIDVLLNEDVKGGFQKFSGTVEVDREKFIGNTKIETDADSIFTNYDSNYKDLIRGDSFFDLKHFPKIILVAKNFYINTKDQNTISHVSLTIKGHEKEFDIPLNYIFLKNEHVILNGSFTIHRNDFEIGSGPWSETFILKDEIKVLVNLELDKN
jgi:polyisoprenoid-binding protein YceI